MPPVDHHTLFPLVDAVVCHGGVNTCAAALAAERPLILVPQWFDQYYWAGRFEELGLAVTARRRVRTLTDAHHLLARFEAAEFRSPPPSVMTFSGTETICRDLGALLSEEHT